MRCLRPTTLYSSVHGKTLMHHTNSACVTSVLRTYYTWKVGSQPDVSYNIAKMGLWTLAEVAIGVIVSCLPVLPRFVRDVGPKLRRAFSIRTKPSLNLGSENVQIIGRPSSTSPTSPHSIPTTARDMRIQKAHAKGSFTELEEYNTVISEVNASHQPRPSPIRPHRDLESGGYGFPMRDTFYSKTRLDPSVSI